MAERRMFAKSIIDSDAFLDMPLSTQALYFHLSMRADDDGFVGNPKRIKGMIGASEDDLKLLIAKRFLFAFESGVVVIKHWRVHNYLRNDRYKETAYIEEKSQLFLNKNNAYIEKIIDGIPVVYQMSDKRYTQDRLGKDSIEIELGKDSIDKRGYGGEKEEVRPLPSTTEGETSSPTPSGKSKKDKYIELLQASSLSTKVQEQVIEWLEYKKWKYTEVGLKSLLTTVAKNVDKYGEEVVCTVIVESMGNMWQGICWDKLERQGKVSSAIERAITKGIDYDAED